MILDEEINIVAGMIESDGLSEVLVSKLRERFPGKHFTYCMEDDINVGKPVHQGKGYLIYLVDSRDHCSVLTNDADNASGFVLAEVFEDD